MITMIFSVVNDDDTITNDIEYALSQALFQNLKKCRSLHKL